MKLKPGVNPLGIRPELLVGLMAAAAVYTRHGFDLTITSLVDGTHSQQSLHYAGQAADLRIWGINPVLLAQMVREINDALGADYDVILERDHIHLEYQPKR
jgi:hypothetical protein